MGYKYTTVITFRVPRASVGPVGGWVNTKKKVWQNRAWHVLI